MSDTPPPQLYLVTPPSLDPAPFADTLAGVLDATPFACLRLALVTEDEARILRAADTLRAVTEARDVPLVVTDRVTLARNAGLDGVHLLGGARGVREARRTLGPDAIVGAFCRASRHDGMTAGEIGADYVAFGPVGGAAAQDGEAADHDLFAWWSEMIEVPVIAEGGVDPATAAALAPLADFIALGEEIWSDDDPPGMARRYAASVG